MADTSVTVQRLFDMPARDIFDVVSNPEWHPRIDGSGYVRSEDTADRITGTGQVFRMNMEGDHMGGEYKTDNTVIGYEKDKLLAWQTAPAGTTPPGWEWVWKLEPQGPDQTRVSLTYDWSRVTDKELLRKLSFPLMTPEQLDGSLANLASVLGC